MNDCKFCKASRKRMTEEITNLTQTLHRSEIAFIVILILNNAAWIFAWCK